VTIRQLARFVTVLWVALMLVLAVTSYTLPGASLDFDGLLAAALCWVIVGGVLTIKVPSNLVGPLAMVAGSAWVVFLFGSRYGAASLASTGSVWWGAYLFAWLGAWVGALLPIGVTLLILVFPTGKPVGWWRLVMAPPLAGLLSTFVGAVFLWGLPLPTLINDDLVSRVDAYGLVDAGFIVGFAFAVPAAVSMVVRYRRAALIERQQIKWLLAATSLFAVVYVVTVTTDDSNETAWLVLSAALAAIPLAIILAVLRYRLYDIDRILSRTISYAIVLGLLGGVYLFGLTSLTSLFLDDSPLAVAASTLAAAALFNPVRTRVQSSVEKRFNRSRYDAQRVMETFSGSLREDLDPDAVVGGWVDVVAETMQPSSVGVWVQT
jgi:MFS family permease